MRSQRLVTIESILPSIGVATCYWYERNERCSELFRTAELELLAADPSEPEPG